MVGGVLLATLEEVLGTEIFNEAVKGAVAEAYFFLADIFIRWPDIYNIYNIYTLISSQHGGGDAEEG